VYVYVIEYQTNSSVQSVNRKTGQWLALSFNTPLISIRC